MGPAPDIRCGALGGCLVPGFLLNDMGCMEHAENIIPLKKAADTRRRVSVAVILALSFGALVLAAAGGVLALTVAANYQNTFDLLGKSANLLVDAMDDSLRAHMDRAQEAANGVARVYAAGRFEIDDSGAMTAALSGALASVPDAAAMLIYDRDMNYRGVASGHPDESGVRPLVTIAKQPVANPSVEAALAKRAQVGGVLWGDFAVREGHIYANVSVPLVRGGETQGWVVAPIDLLTLSAITQDLSTRFETTAFIMDGDDRILAHPHLMRPGAPGLGNGPTVPLSSFDDPVLAHFGERRIIDYFPKTSAPGVEFSEIQLAAPSDAATRPLWDPEYILITKQVSGYGASPWKIGAYFAKRALGDEIMRVWISAVIGLAMLGVALIVAVLLGKRLARPVRAIASQAHLVADLNLEGVKPLPRSRVLEFDDQAAAFNAMLTGLRAFSAYVPRSLVAKLVRSGDVDARLPREALVTVMFTDIVGFTTIAEQLPANAGAELLNHHFALLCEAIDAEGGTIDKFLGDGIMAFFGAPDRLQGHVAAAVRAAIAIREVLHADNAVAREKGLPPLRVRIGIHTGLVIVGDIGASDRVNYTIIGDTVNVSQRLQELGKLVAPDAECAIVISGETAARLDGRAHLAASGKHRLRGRGEPVEVFTVEDAANLGGQVKEPKIAQEG
jgi:adenylate cyclase